jgi:hypothetical protein
MSKKTYAALFLCLAGGCVPDAGRGPAGTAAPGTLPAPGPRTVAVQGGRVGSAEEARPDPAAFLEQVRLAASAEGPGSLKLLVQRWPDSALDVLRDTGGADGARPDRLAVARVYDEVFEVRDPGAGWTAALSRQAADLEVFAAFRSARTQVLELMRDGRFADAADVSVAGRLPADAPAMTAAEAWRITGMAALMAERFADAEAAWSKSAAAAVDGPRHVRMELELMLSEARRRLGRTEAAIESWRNAVIVGAAARDPELWDRAVAGRPPQSPWPAEVPAAWARTASTRDDAAAGPITNGDVLMRIGRMRLSRGALQTALLTFSRAEAEMTDARTRGLARLYRAQTMVALQQIGGALPMLEALVRDADPSIGRRAQAVLGDVLCRALSDYRRGLPILREAVSSADGGEWPDKSRSMANLGLYCLLDGREKEGLRWLHEAQLRFEREGRLRELADALKNEAAYHRENKRPDEAEAVQRRADILCRQSGLPVETLTDRAAPASAPAPKDDRPAAGERPSE